MPRIQNDIAYLFPEFERQSSDSCCTMKLNNTHIASGTCAFPISFKRNKKLCEVYSLAYQTHFLPLDPMQTEYSVSDLAAARSLQTSTVRSSLNPTAVDDDG
jgi:hypothetical protein